ncbi:MAG: hypothetical protein JWM36_4326 [Hyphomicrobiales bacterium]|nr:hypothetical protein [Hyphomicrobiales bacterium]
MIVIFDKNTLQIEQCVTIAAEDYTDFLDASGMGWIRIEETFTPDRIGVVLFDDRPTVILRQSIPLTGPSTATVGQAVTFTGIPEGTIVSGDAGTVVMDTTSELDISFETPGNYVIAFSHPAYLRQEVSLAVKA